MAQSNAELEARILQIESTYVTSGQVSKASRTQDDKIQQLSLEVDSVENEVENLRSAVAPIAASIQNTDSYLHTQGTASDTWTITHGLDFKYVVVVAFNDSDPEAQITPTLVEFLNDNTVRLSFTSVVGGGALIAKIA